MLRVSLRGVLARRTRAFGVALAVFLGVSLVGGTLVFTDTINRSFDELFAQTLEGTDVVVTPREVVQQDIEGPPPFPEALLERAQRVEGVDAAEGTVSGLARVVDAEGEPLGNDFAPSFVFSAGDERFDPVTYEEGGGPSADGEVALDANTAELGGIEVGDRIGVAGDRALQRFRVVGTFTLGEASTGGSTQAVLREGPVRAATGRPQGFDQISIAATEGVDGSELARRVDEALPRTVRVETASESASRQTAEIDDEFLGVMRTVLLVFGAVVCVVAAFLIFNTFNITVAQRIRELGLLRALGASRPQILTTVLVEAAVVGLIASLLGLAGGVGTAIGLRAMFDAVGVDLPSSGTSFQARTAIVAVALGLLMTIASSLAPALRATRVSPMAALLEAELPERRRHGRARAAVAVLLAAAGLALLVVGLFGGVESADAAAGMMGGGAAAVLLAVSLYTPRLVVPLASLVGRPIERVRGMTGRLARENAVRKPGRTAVTSAALMIGLALVTFVTVFAAGLSSSIENSVEEGITADVVVQNRDGFSPFSRDATRDAAEVEGVGSISGVAATSVQVAGVADEVRTSGIEPETLLDGVELEWQEGSDQTLRGLGDRQAVIEDGWAEDNGVAVGDELSVLSKNRRRTTFEVTGRFTQEAGVLGRVLVTRTAATDALGERRDSAAFIALAGGASGTVDRLQRLVGERYPAAQALDRQELVDNQQEQITPVLGLFYALLSLAVLVSLVGVANTLGLSIHERTRELGMLRAVGMSRRQVKRVIRYEAVITALIGAIMGVTLGVLLAALVSQPLADEGFEVAYPIDVLVGLLVVAGLAGVVTAIGPARRAARLDVLEALAYE